MSYLLKLTNPNTGYIINLDDTPGIYGCTNKDGELFTTISYNYRNMLVPIFGEKSLYNLDGKTSISTWPIFIQALTYFSNEILRNKKEDEEITEYLDKSNDYIQDLARTYRVISDLFILSLKAPEGIWRVY